MNSIHFHRRHRSRSRSRERRSRSRDRGRGGGRDHERRRSRDRERSGRFWTTRHNYSSFQTWIPVTSPRCFFFFMFVLSQTFPRTKSKISHFEAVTASKNVCILDFSNDFHPIKLNIFTECGWFVNLVKHTGTRSCRVWCNMLSVAWWLLHRSCYLLLLVLVFYPQRILLSTCISE